MFNGCIGCDDILTLLMLYCCGENIIKKIDCKDLLLLYTVMNCCGGKDKCC